MRLIISFFKRYPAQSVVTLCAVLFAGLAEGFGFTMLLPLLNLALNRPGDSGIAATHPPSSLERYVSSFFDIAGLSPTIGVLLVFFVLSIVLKALFVLLANKRVGYMVAQVATDLRLDLIHALFASRWEYFVHQPAGRFGNAFAMEANRSSSAYTYVIRIIVALIFTAVYASIALVLAWKATLATLVAGVLILFVLRGLVKKSKMAGKNQTLLLKSVLTLLNDTLQSIKPLRAMAREKSAVLVLDKETKHLHSALQEKVFSAEGMKALQEPLITIYFAVVLYFALVWWKLPLSSLLLMVFMLVKILKALQKVQSEYTSLVNVESAYWSLLTTIQETKKEKELILGTFTPTFNNAIRLENVDFCYHQQPVLQEASLIIPKGSFTSLIGPSGAGKTTIVDLITGLLLAKKGKVSIDEMGLSSVDLQAWRQMIGYVPQETLLLHDTVLVNVTLGDAELTENDVEDALRDAGALSFIQEMPDGINTVVGERGNRLSGGQRQRITIARALVRKPALLILDEATSALDPASEVEICQTLSRLRGKLTILAISHQTALLDASDRAYRVEGGTAKLIKDQGQQVVMTESQA